MKAGIIGMGTVGRAAALAAMQRGSANELVLVNRHSELSEAVALDLGYGGPLSASSRVTAGTYDDLGGAGVVVITAGVNEKHGGATDRTDSAGRLRLLQSNAKVMHEVVPRLIEAEPEAVIVVATDPPDVLADMVRDLAPSAKVLSTGTWLDSLRFRTQLAKAFHINPRSIQADVLGEHGTSELFHWSAASVAGVPVSDVVAAHRIDEAAFRTRVEDDVRFANINIIEGLGASQYGIGIVIARIIEAVLRDERIVVPVGSYHGGYGATFSLPSILGASGVEGVIEPRLDSAEQETLRRSIAKLKQATHSGEIKSAPAATIEPERAASKATT